MSERDEATGHDDYLIALALFVAIQTLRASKHPPVSNIEQMEGILHARYPQYAQHFEFQNEIKRALRMGYAKEDGPMTLEQLRVWIAERAPSEDANVIALFDRE